MYLFQLQLFIEDNLLHCMKFDDHPYCINHSDLRMDTGRTNRHIMYGNSFFNIKMENFKLIIILLNLYLWVLPVCKKNDLFCLMYEYYFYLEMLMKSLTSLLILFRLNYAHFISHMMDSIE